MKLFLVDDDVFLRDMYATKFTECGHTVEVVGSGEEGLQMLRTDDKYDALLIDVVMPGMSGVELLQKMRDESLAEDAIKIMLSNQGQPADITDAQTAGASSYIIKAEHIPSAVVDMVESIVSEGPGDNN